MLFVYRLIPPRPTFAQDMDESERETMNGHVEHFGRVHATGRLLIYGPVLDATGSWGLGVISAESEDAARAIADADPAVASRLCTYELGPMPQAVLHPSLAGFA